MIAWPAITIIIGTLLPVLPQLITGLPGPYKDIATGLLAAAGLIYHWLQPSPTQVAAQPPPITVVKP